MSISNINNSDVPNINPIDATTNGKSKQQYREQYQQLLSQHEAAFDTWRDTVSDVKTQIGESVRLAIDNQLKEAKEKLAAFQAAMNASEPSEEILKTMTEELTASLNNVTAYIAAVPTSVADTADIAALRETWEGLSDTDKTLIGSEFTQSIEAKFAAFNAKIVELQKAIADGADASDIEKLQSEIFGLKMQLSTLINGTTDGSAMSVTDRIACSKSLEEAKDNKYVSDEQYETLKQQLLQTDVLKQISKENFEEQLDAIIAPAIQDEVQKNVEATESASERAAVINELLKNNIALKVMQEKNNFLEFKLNAEADAKLQEKAEFNPQVKQLRDEGRWQTPEMTRQREVTQMQNEDERRREATAQVR